MWDTQLEKPAKLCRCLAWKVMSATWVEPNDDEDIKQVEADGRDDEPTPVVAKARPMPTHERLGLDDREDLKNRREPSIQPDKEPAITVGEPNPAAHLTPQNDQLMSKCRVLCCKPPLRLEWRGQDGQDEAEQRKHCALPLGDSFSRSNADGVFGTHTGPAPYAAKRSTEVGVPHSLLQADSST